VAAGVLADVRRVLAIGVVVALLLVLGGATIQGVVTAVERRRFPHPGRLVDVGGHQLHLDCHGSGQPVVVLEAPLMGLSSAWAAVWPQVSTTTRVCSYDRAGLGWSEAGDESFDPNRALDELHALFSRAGERGPIVLAGHEFGAALAAGYAARYPADLAALVLIDPPEVAGDTATPRPSVSTALPWLARAGVLRASGFASRYGSGLPGEANGALRAFLNRPDHLSRSADESMRWDDTIRLGAASPSPSDLPVRRVTTTGTGGLATLGETEPAARIAAAIVAVVETAREQR
jgi:pimeloyl-ACP methyl ester carboxylesterase